MFVRRLSLEFRNMDKEQLLEIIEALQAVWWRCRPVVRFRMQFCMARMMRYRLREKKKKPRKRADKKTRKEWAMAERVTKMKYQCRKVDVATRRPYQIKERRIKR